MLEGEGKGEGKGEGRWTVGEGEMGDIGRELGHCQDSFLCNIPNVRG